MSDVHVVLVPGFGGFDVLGNLQYYAGLTPLLARWQDEGFDRAAASRCTTSTTSPPRACTPRVAPARLPRQARRAPGVPRGGPPRAGGSSTGGLDVRALLRRLRDDGAKVSLRRRRPRRRRRGRGTVSSSR
ncbi:MAG: hypothetical protein R3A52_06905 [Polyangiales bacterium]